MLATRLLLVLSVTSFLLPSASASHWDASGSADCQTFGAAACRLTLRVSPAVAVCEAAGCWFWIDCFWTISGTLARAEGSCFGTSWVQPCGTGSCNGGVLAGRYFFPRGCTPVSASGVGHGLVADSTRLLTVTSNLCI
jgi:hypothetical protein